MLSICLLLAVYSRALFSLERRQEVLRDSQNFQAVEYKIIFCFSNILGKSCFLVG